jgi:hypothetical protein
VPFKAKYEEWVPGLAMAFTNKKLFYLQKVQSKLRADKISDAPRLSA